MGNVPALAEIETVPGVVPLGGGHAEPITAGGRDGRGREVNRPWRPCEGDGLRRGSAPPPGWINVKPAAVGAGVAVIVPEFTANVTLMVAGLFPAFGEVTTTVPV